MDPASQLSVTQLLQAWSSGDRQALDRLVPAVYGELRRLTLRTHGNSLQPTALINELYLQLAGANGVSLRDRSQFFGLAAQMMRRILVDAARTRGASKHDGPEPKIVFDEDLVVLPRKDHELVALDDALDALAKMDPRKARAVELRFFGGLSIEETAEVLGVSIQTVRRDWNFAQSWLSREVGPKQPDE